MVNPGTAYRGLRSITERVLNGSDLSRHAKSRSEVHNRNVPIFVPSGMLPCPLVGSTITAVRQKTFALYSGTRPARDRGYLLAVFT